MSSEKPKGSIIIEEQEDDRINAFAGVLGETATPHMVNFLSTAATHVFDNTIKMEKNLRLFSDAFILLAIESLRHMRESDSYVTLTVLSIASATLVSIMACLSKRDRENFMSSQTFKDLQRMEAAANRIVIKTKLLN